MDDQAKFVDFIQKLHSRTPDGYGIEIRPIPGAGRTYPLDQVEAPGDITSRNYYHSVFPRRMRDGVSDVGFIVWCDTDGSQDDLSDFEPKPTVVVHSGRVNGYHLYWKLDSGHDPEPVERVCKLAAVALKGDFQVCQHRLNFRAPYSMNTKYNPPRQVKVLEESWDTEYELKDLEEWFVAAAIAPHYVDGERHQLTMAISAILARAEWDVERALRVVQHLYDLNPGNDLQGKLADVRSTFMRVGLGQPVSSAAVRAVLGDDPYKRFLEALGITQRDGDVLINGERVGTVTNLERDVTNYLLAQGNWAAAAGRPAQWDDGKGFWRLSDDSGLTSEVFSMLSTAQYVRQGEVMELPATAKTAKAVTSVTTGKLLRDPLEPADPHLLPLLNGTLDLRDQTLQPTKREHRHLWRIDIPFDESAVSQSWLAFIEEAAPDPEIRGYLQEWVGYCLAAGNPWEKLLWLHGPQGTGKSTFIKGISLMLGSSAVAISADKFDAYTVAQLDGARAGMCSELSPKLLRTGVIKALVSGDPVQGRHPYGRPFTVKFRGKMIWGSNELPTMDQGEGMWRRIVPVEFRNPPARVIARLDDRLREEASGILNWSITGLRRLLPLLDEDSPWPIPTRVEKTLAEYRRASNPMQTFANEELDTTNPDDHVPVLEVYKRWAEWAKERGIYVRALDPIFFQELSRLGFEVDNTYVNGSRGGLYLRGGKMKPGIWGTVPAAPAGMN